MTDENLAMVKQWEGDLKSLIDMLTLETKDHYRGIGTGDYREAVWQIIRYNVKYVLNEWMIEIIKNDVDNQEADNIYRLYKESIRLKNDKHIS